MLHFRIQYQHEIKAFLVQYDADWDVIAAKVTELFEIPANYVALVHKDRDGVVTTIRNHEDLRGYLLGPRSARAVAGLPLDFDLKDVREWKYSIVSNIPESSEMEDTDFDRAVTDDINELLSPDHVGIGRFTDDDYTFINRPPTDPSDVHLVIPGSEESYPVPRHLALGSTPNIHLVELKQQEEDGTWDQVQAPSPPTETTEKPPSVHSQHSVDYPNVYLEEPVGKPLSVASSGPPRIPAKEKGKGRAMPLTLDPIPLGLYTAVDVSSNASVANNEAPTKPTIQIPETPPQVMSPIPLISNIVRKMSLENARAHTIGEGADTPIARSVAGGPTSDNQYETLVTQLVSLVDVVSQLLQDEGVAHQVRTAWDGFASRPSPGPFSAVSASGNKPKELALAEGLVTVMKRVQTIVEEDPLSEVEEQDEDVIWTHRSRGQAGDSHPLSAIAQHFGFKTPTHKHPPAVKSPTSPKNPDTKAVVSPPPPPVAAKTSKQRLEDAKAVYKAEKTRYRAEREHRRREKFTAKGLAYPEPANRLVYPDPPRGLTYPNPPLGVIESNEPPVEVRPAPPGHRASLMSEPDRSRASGGAIPSHGASLNRATSTVRAAPGSTYSPALLPAHISFPPAPSSVARLPSVASPTAKQLEAQREAESAAAADGGSEGGFGTPRASVAPLRPERASTQFDFDKFMELNAWKQNLGQSSIGGGSARSSMLPPPPTTKVLQAENNPVTESPRPMPMRAESENTAPTPPPRPRELTPSYSAHGFPQQQQQQQQQLQQAQQPSLESALHEAFRNNPTPRGSLKRSRWTDGMSSLRRDAGRQDSRREDSIVPEANPPPVYSTDGEGDDAVLETGGPVRVEKGSLPVNEEFKRRVFAVLQQYNVTQDLYPNLDTLISNGIQVVNAHRSMVRLAAESNAHARETFLSEEVPNIVNRVLATVQRRSMPTYV
ncbi:hypothetical protein FRC17_006939 [Serendipita sp. 399]|nr:hypothetical protein FRC17_006939 [Serendipita sp. 399]